MSKYDYYCKHCKKTKGQHHAKTNGCPMGSKTSIGYTMYSEEQVFEHDGKEPENPDVII